MILSSLSWFSIFRSLQDNCRVILADWVQWKPIDRVKSFATCGFLRNDMKELLNEYLLSDFPQMQE